MHFDCTILKIVHRMWRFKVRASGSDMEGRGFNPRSGYTKYFKIGSNGFPRWHSWINVYHNDWFVGVSIKWLAGSSPCAWCAP